MASAYSKHTHKPNVNGSSACKEGALLQRAWRLPNKPNHRRHWAVRQQAAPHSWAGSEGRPVGSHASGQVQADCG